MQRESRAAERDWEKASKAYARHLREVQAKLPPSARALSNMTLHDGIVRALEQSPNRVRIMVDAL